MSYFEREDWTLFRSLQTIGQKAGVPREKVPRLVVKELVDNALDAGGTCDWGFLDDENRDQGLYVEDNGPGLPGRDEEIAALFSVARPLTSSKLLRLPTRGTLGNGLRVVAGAVLASGGHLVVKTRGRALRLLPRDADGGTDVERLGRWDGKGTRVEVRFGPSLSIDEDLFEWAERAGLFLAGGEGYKGRTSAWWYDSDSLYELLQAAGERHVRDLVEGFDGCSGKKAGTICRAFPRRSCRSLTRKEAEDLLRALRGHAKLVKPQRLGFVGEELGIRAAYARTTGTFETKAGRGKLGAKIPFVIEVWAEEADRSSVLVHVNRTPITADVFTVEMRDRTFRGLAGCGLSSEKENSATPIKTGRNRHFTFLVNVTTPYMPITTDGKEPDLSLLHCELSAVMAKAAKRAKRRRAGTSLGVTQKGVIRDALPDAIDKASGNGRYRYSLRRLFYAVRPFFLEIFREEPDYDYFSQVVTEYEGELGHDLEGIYRDDRGTLYHPHLGEEMPLGTRSIENYERPSWTFNKILYCEKEGFFPMLLDARWPERHDCALLTSKGYASRAARDALDLLGDTSEALTFFCIHDADGYGTMIYQALTEGTQARPGRRVEVFNLGLDPEEAQEMRLPSERFERKRKAVPVADYIEPEWAEWLQTNRVELDAMEPDVFLFWLDKKMKGLHGKLVPPTTVLQRRVADRVREGLLKELREEAIRAARVDEKAEATLAKLKPRLDAMNGTLKKRVKKHLDRTPEHHWTSPVDRVASGIVNRHFGKVD